MTQLRAKLSRFTWEDLGILSEQARQSLRALARFGAYVRGIARQSMPKRPGSSSPGKPPHAHGTGLLKKFLLFAVEKEGAPNVVIGPEGLFGRNKGDAPATLEYGGSVQTQEVQIHFPNGGTKFLHVGRKAYARAKAGERRTRTVAVAPRPYMGPAFERGKQRLPSIWEESLK